MKKNRLALLLLLPSVILSQACRSEVVIGNVPSTACLHCPPEKCEPLAKPASCQEGVIPLGSGLCVVTSQGCNWDLFCPDDTSLRPNCSLDAGF